MEDWQGCLSPECQTALLLAREQVSRRSGSVITVEDFLLALLDAIPALPPFLKRQGVDLDEFVRTVQGEQPIVTEVSGDGDLSSQLIYWISSTREASAQAWLDWPDLLRALVDQCERLQDKAYVAVLELVGQWSQAGDARSAVGVAGTDDGITPVTVTDAAWLELAEDVAVALSADPSALIWVHGPKGSGKTAWLQVLLSAPGLAWVQVDPRRESEILSCDQPVIPSGPGVSTSWPALVLDNTSPAALLTLMSEPAGLIRELVMNWQGPILLLAAGHPGDKDATRLAQWLGREWEARCVPAISVAQRRAILGAHQPSIEKHWNIQLSAAALDYAATRQSRSVAGPGGLLQWVQRAAARLDQFAARGPIESWALAGQQDALRRQTLVALARGEAIGHPEQSLKALEIERTASEVMWHERQRAGTLRRLLVEDLRQELERWVAARPGPGHYVAHHEPSQGDTLGARSGNLHS
ncbi:MAG: hypothetical protein B7X58_00570 [Marinobacter sp. 34-60-7]|nr:MAG: hypothetical protein B7X58_00570 [Marinobacter sp. 34-60-7]